MTVSSLGHVTIYSVMF